MAFYLLSVVIYKLTSVILQSQIQKIIKYINGSPQYQQKFMEVQHSEGHNNHEIHMLLQDCQTQWNSIYQMLCCALALQHEIRVYIYGVPDTQIQQLRLQEEE